MSVENVHQILLRLEDGRKVSIIQDRNSYDFKHSATLCDVWIEGEQDPIQHLTAEQLITYLMTRKLCTSAERTWEKEQSYA